MKLNGKKIGSSEVVIPIIRPEGDFYFKARAIASYDEFEKLCPMPVPPTRLLPGGARQQMIHDPKFVASMGEWANLRGAWVVLHSLRATEGLEWEQVNLQDPTTWAKYREELTESGLCESEIARIINGVAEANGLDQSKVEEARERFLTAAANLAANPSSPQDDPQTTSSGVPANA